MQWEAQIAHDESLTVKDLLDNAAITENYGQYTLLVGARSAQQNYMILSTESPLLGQLSCSVKRLTEARLALLSWTEKNASGSGHTLVRSVRKHSDGWQKCLQVIEWSQVVSYLALGVCHVYA